MFWAKVNPLLKKVPALSFQSYQIKEEIDGSVFHGHAFGIAYHAVVRIPDSAIAIYPAQHGEVAILHSSVVVDIAQHRIVRVTYRIVVNLGNEPVIGVLDVSITVDPCHQAVVAVPDLAIGIDGYQDGIVAIPYRLSLNASQAQDHHYRQYKSLHIIYKKVIHTNHPAML